MNSTKIGDQLYRWARELFPVNRSITGEGTRKTLLFLQEIVPEMTIEEVPTGTKAFDWEIPKEWNVREAWIKNDRGEKVVDFAKHNLHLVGYSAPVHKNLSLDELQNHLHSLPGQPDAIPYVTSYYQKRWGFCLTHSDRESLSTGTYEVLIDSTLKNGSLSYGEVCLPGKLKEEIFLSTYVCHPSMANNEISGPLVAAAIAQWIKSIENRRYSYRIIFIPETIGSITYLSKHLQYLKETMVAGFVLTCLGDNRSYSMLESRFGNTLADKIAKHVLRYHSKKNVKIHSFLKRGSDERQYCAPGIDLPVCSLMRTKYGEYPEYHTSLDNLDLISPEGLQGGYDFVKKAIHLLENNRVYRTKVLGEPQLGKRGMYPTLSKKENIEFVRHMTNIIAYADGTSDLVTIAEIIGASALDLIGIAENLVEEGLFEVVDR